MKCLENKTGIDFVFLHRIEENGDIVGVNIANLANVLSEYPIHESLPRCHSVAQSLWHDQPFEHPKWCLEGCRVNAVLFHAHLVERRGAIEEAEDLGQSEATQYLILTGKRGMILDCIFIEHAIIVDHARHGCQILGLGYHPSASGHIAA